MKFPIEAIGTTISGAGEIRKIIFKGIVSLFNRKRLKRRKWGSGNKTVDAKFKIVEPAKATTNEKG